MKKNFDNKEKAAAAGRKSKRGESKEVKDLRLIVKSLLEKNHGKLEKWLDQLAEENPEEALSVFEQLTDQALPQFESVKAPLDRLNSILNEKEKQEVYHTVELYELFNQGLPDEEKRKLYRMQGISIPKKLSR